MSVFSVSALDRLIEPSSRDDDSSSSASNEKRLVRERRPLYTYSAYSPAAITSNWQRSPSSSSFSSSPFIVNFKGRRGVRQEAQKPFVEDGVSKSMPQIKDTGNESMIGKPEVTPLTGNSQEGNGKEGTIKLDLDAVTNEPDSNITRSHCIPGNFPNEKDCSSYMGKNSLDNSMQVPRNEEEVIDCSVSGDEFYDAPESPAYGSAIGDALLYDGKLSSTYSGDVSNLDELEAEVEQCVSAQKALLTSKQQHEAVLGKLFLSGSSSTTSYNQVTGRSCADLSCLLDQTSHRLEVARLVGCAVARGAAKAEAKEELEMIIDIKNREILRLRDKLHYYETINHEMSQRNQESMEIARRQRRERRRKLHLTIGCIAVTACLGISATALYRYVPWEDLKAWRSSSDCIEFGANMVRDDIIVHVHTPSEVASNEEMLF